MADDYIRLSELQEATDAQITNSTLMEVSVENQETISGYETRKSPLSKLANYILNSFNSLSLGGTQRTVKSAIDAIGTAATDATTIIGNSTMGTTASTITGAIAELVSAVGTIATALGSLKVVNITMSGTSGTIYERIRTVYESGAYPIGVPFVGIQTSGQSFFIAGYIYTANSQNYGGIVAASYTGLTYYRLYEDTWVGTYLDRTENFTVTSAGSYYTIARQKCYKSGSRVFISVEVNVAVANPPTAADIVTIPEKYRPLSSLNGLGFVCRENANGVRNFRPALVSVGSSGSVRQSLSSAMAIGDIVTLWAEYIIE